MFPERGEENLDGWDTVLNLNDEGIDGSRTMENQLWTAFEINNLHETETMTELEGCYSYLGTNMIYNNGVT